MKQIGSTAKLHVSTEMTPEEDAFAQDPSKEDLDVETPQLGGNATLGQLAGSLGSSISSRERQEIYE